MIFARHPWKPHTPSRTDVLADAAAAIGTVVMLAAIGFFVLTGDDPLPDVVHSAAHRAFVAGLCPHLPDEEGAACRDWLAGKGGRP